MLVYYMMKNFGFINTKCANNGKFNIYGLPTKLNCYSYGYSKVRNLYTGLNSNKLEDDCILVMNNWQQFPTISTLQLFCYRLYTADRVADININAQRTPILLICDDKQRLTIENLYNKFEGNAPVIFGDKNQIGKDSIDCIQTNAPFVADKIIEYKKEIWNEALTFLRY